MKKIITLIATLCVSGSLCAQSVTLTPTGGIYAKDKDDSGGFLSLTSRTNHLAELIIVNDKTNIYYQGNNLWFNYGTITLPSSVSYKAGIWSSLGNKGLGSNDFLGTTDAQPLRFRTNNTERMKILSDGRVGIGNGDFSPSTRLHINNGNSAVTANSGTYAPTVFIERDNHTYLELDSPNDKERGINFSNPADGISGGIYYSNKSMSFRTNANNTRLLITDTGNVSIGSSTPAAKLVVEGDFALKGVTTINLNGGITNLDRNGKSIIYFSAESNGVLRGIGGGVEGMIVYLMKDTPAAIVITDNDSIAPAGSRILTHTGSSFVSGAGYRLGGITLIYINNVWRIVSIAE